LANKLGGYYIEKIDLLHRPLPRISGGVAPRFCQRLPVFYVSASADCEVVFRTDFLSGGEAGGGDFWIVFGFDLGGHHP
jgi:hypothetical protein